MRRVHCCTQREDSNNDSDDQCTALSDRWTYQRHSRLWSRLDSVDLPSSTAVQQQASVSRLSPPGTADGSLRSTVSWDSALETSLVGSSSSVLDDSTVRRQRDVPFPQPTTGLQLLYPLYR